MSKEVLIIGPNDHKNYYISFDDGAFGYVNQGKSPILILITSLNLDRYILMHFDFTLILQMVLYTIKRVMVDESCGIQTQVSSVLPNHPGKAFKKSTL